MATDGASGVVFRTADTGGTPAPVVVDDEPDVPSFGLLLTLGLLTIGFGLVMLVWPGLTVRVYAVLAGIWLMIEGATRIVDAFRSRPGLGRRTLSGIVGVVLFIGGAACLRDVARGVTVLAMIVAVAWLLSGVAWWVAALRGNGSARRWLVILALVSFALGLGFLLWPEASLGIMVWLTGLGSLAVGMAEVLFAFVWRRAGDPARART